MAGKGSQRRPTRISKEEDSIRWKLALGEISSEEFDRQYKKLEEQGKIVRK